MRYAVIVWRTDSDVLISNGDVYLWCESITTAINTALNLTQSGIFEKAVVVKML